MTTAIGPGLPASSCRVRRQGERRVTPTAHSALGGQGQGERMACSLGEKLLSCLALKYRLSGNKGLITAFQSQLCRSSLYLLQAGAPREPLGLHPGPPAGMAGRDRAVGESAHHLPLGGEQNRSRSGVQGPPTSLFQGSTLQALVVGSSVAWKSRDAHLKEKHTLKSLQ